MGGYVWRSGGQGAGSWKGGKRLEPSKEAGEEGEEGKGEEREGDQGDPEPSKAPLLEAQATLPINSLKAFLSASESWSGFIDKNRYCFRAECVNESQPWTTSTCLEP